MAIYLFLIFGDNINILMIFQMVVTQGGIFEIWLLENKDNDMCDSR